MINFQYLRAELFRRRTKTTLIAIGLAVPIALVIVIGAYSTGLSNAQDEVLEPLVGLGTDMTVTKTADANDTAGGGGPPRIGLADREAGEKFTEDTFSTGANATFNSDAINDVKNLSGVESASGALSVTNIKVSGTVPDIEAGGQVGPGAGGGGAGGGPDSIDIDSKTVTGLSVDSDLGPIASDQLQTGSLLETGDHKQAVITSGYAKTNSLEVGESLTLKGDKFEVVGIVSNPLAGSSSDIYVKLEQLQELADLEDKVNTVYVRASTQDAVAAVSGEIKNTIDSATVTTNASLAGQVGGSLVDANKLVTKMGVFLQLILLLAAIVITGIFTLNAVNKRTREFGTLKSIGWGNPRLIKQVMAESLSTGLIGAAFGVMLGIVAMAVGKLMPLTMQVTGTAGQGLAERLGVPRGAGAAIGAQGGPPGMGRQATQAATETISIVPTLGVSTILIAAAIGAVTALIAGALGSLKTSRLSPVEALKHVD